MRKKKIIIFNAGSNFYGAERGLLNLISALENDYKVEVFLPFFGPLSKIINDSCLSVSLKSFPFPILAKETNLFNYLIFVLRAFLSLVYLPFYFVWAKADIICSNSLLLVVPALAARISGKKHIWYLREFFPNKILNRTLGSIVKRSSDLIIAQSETIASKLNLDHLAKVIYEPVSLGEKRTSPDLLKKKFNLSGSSLVISVVSRIHPSKGQFEFLESIVDLLKDSDLVLLFVGDITSNKKRYRNYKNKIINLIETYQLSNVKMLGFLLDVAEIYDLSDICVFPFLREEPFGIAVAEALSRGCLSYYPMKAGGEELFRLFGKGENYDIVNLKKNIRNFGLVQKDKVAILPESLRIPRYSEIIKNAFSVL